MRSLAAFVFFTIAAVILAAPSKKCGENEAFNECGSACEPSCKQPVPFICTLQCVIGCQCKPGFFRDDNGKCIKNCPNSRNTRAADPCSAHKCPKNKKCVLKEVQCIRAPCDPIPDCV